MKLCIGIEGGGTTTRILAQRDDQQPEFLLVPASFKVRNGDFAASAAALAELLRSILPEPDTRNPTPVPLAIGLSGMSRVEDQEALGNAIHAIPQLRKTRLHIETDATLTLSAVLPEGQEGVLLISGTGSVCYYRTKDGMTRRIGGWGSLLSDGGSGYMIGIESLRTYMYMLDGAFRPDALTMAMENWLPDPLKRDQYALTQYAEQHPDFVASIAKLTFEQYGYSNEAAEIIEEAASELPSLILPILSSKLLTGPQPHNIFLSGSVAKHPLMIESMKMWIHEDEVSFIAIDEHVPCMKALEIARSL